MFVRHIVSGRAADKNGFMQIRVKQTYNTPHNNNNNKKLTQHTVFIIYAAGADAFARSGGEASVCAF